MALTTHEAARLRQLEAEFAAAGGRGVELADEIDALRAKRDRNRGRVRYMRVTVRRVEEITYEATQSVRNVEARFPVAVMTEMSTCSTVPRHPTAHTVSCRATPGR